MFVDPEIIRELVIFGAGLVFGALFGMIILAVLTASKGFENIRWTVREFVDNEVTDDDKDSL